MRVKYPPAQPESDKVEVRHSATNGYGLYVKEGQKIEVGEILSEFPGPARWIRTDRKGDIPQDEITEYVFALGPFKVKGTKARYSIIWGSDINSYEDYTGSARGHLINSSHPRMKYPCDVTNCVYGVYYDNLVIDLDVEPNVTLYTVCAKPITGGVGPNPLYELRTEYHWCLAYHFGFWCLDPACHECLYALRDYVNKQIALI